MKKIEIGQLNFHVQAYHIDWGFNINLYIGKESYSFHYRLSDGTISNSSFQCHKWQHYKDVIIKNLDFIKQELKEIFP